MNYELFKKEFVDCFVFKPAERPYWDQEINDYYTEFKIMKYESVAEWCEFYFYDWTLKTHHMALKSKTQKSEGNLQSLRRLATGESNL